MRAYQSSSRLLSSYPIRSGINYLVPSPWWNEIVELNADRCSPQQLLLPASTVDQWIETCNLRKLCHEGQDHSLVQALLDSCRNKIQLLQDHAGRTSFSLPLLEQLQRLGNVICDSEMRVTKSHQVNWESSQQIQFSWNIISPSLHARLVYHKQINSQHDSLLTFVGQDHPKEQLEYVPCKQLAVEVLIVTDQQSLAFVGFVQESLSLSTLLADIRKLHGWKESSKIVFVGDVPYMDIPMQQSSALGFSKGVRSYQAIGHLAVNQLESMRIICLDLMTPEECRNRVCFEDIGRHPKRQNTILIQSSTRQRRACIDHSYVSEQMVVELIDSYRSMPKSHQLKTSKTESTQLVSPTEPLERCASKEKALRLNKQISEGIVGINNEIQRRIGDTERQNDRQSSSTDGDTPPMRRKNIVLTPRQDDGFQRIPLPIWKRGTVCPSWVDELRRQGQNNMLAVTAIPGEEDFSQRRIVTTYSLKGMTHRVFIDPVSKLEESQVAVLCKESLSESEILSEPDHELQLLANTLLTQAEALKLAGIESSMDEQCTDKYEVGQESSDLSD